MSYTVLIPSQAQDDLREIRDFIAGDSEHYSLVTVDRILDRIDTLSEFPRRGPRPRDARLRRKGYRFLVEKPYLIFYKVDETHVWIHRVLHGKRAYDRIL